MKEEEVQVIEAKDKNEEIKVGFQGSRKDVGTLAKKLAEVMGEVGKVEKSGRNKYHKYDYAKESDILNAVRPALSEADIFVFSSIEDYERESNGKNVNTIVSILFTFMDGETGASFTVRYVGEGQDSQDKSFYKAYTGAIKYAILKNFLISTDDDPEKDNRTRGKSKSRKQKKPKHSKDDLIKKIKSQYNKNDEVVEEVASKYLGQENLDKDISLLGNLSRKSLVSIIKECKKKL